MACDSPITLKLEQPKIDKKTGKLIYTVPLNCGKCEPCIKRRINQWAFRIDQEKKRSLSAYFVTLTYDTEFVPITEKGNMTLDIKDIQHFMKRLRYYHNKTGVSTLEIKKEAQGYKEERRPIKFYACGEYGELKGRPHYHLIIFNAFIEDIKKAWTRRIKTKLEIGVYKRSTKWNKKGDIKYKWISEEVDIGQIHIDIANANTIYYTVSYMEKKSNPIIKGMDDAVRKKFNVASMGLGDNYMIENAKWHHEDYKRLYVHNGDYKIAMPKYYRDRIFTQEERTSMLGMIKRNVEKKEKEQRRKDIQKKRNPEAMEYVRKRARQNKKNTKNKLREI